LELLLPSLNCHYYTKLKGAVIHSASYFLGVNQHKCLDSGSNLLDHVFSNFADLSVDHDEYGVQLEHFHHPYIVDCTMPVQHCKQNCNISYKRNSAGDYALFFSSLSTYD
jgi:hypothetical protein